MSDEIVNSIWARRRAWSQAANRLGASIARARSIMLVLSSVGAVLATAAATVQGSPDMRAALAAAGSVFLGLSTYIATQWLTSAAFRAWTVTRSVSEALKSEIYLCRTRSGRYAGADRFAQLNAVAVAIEDRASECEAYLAPILPNGGAAPGDLDQQAYIAARISGQASAYFRPTASRYARRARILRIVVVLCGIAASALSALVAYLSATPGGGSSDVDPAAWVAVLTTIGTAVAAHISGRRYDFLILTYLTTARRLESLTDEWRSAVEPMDGAAWSAFVQRCEDVIGATNQSWIAKLAQPEDG